MCIQELLWCVRDYIQSRRHKKSREKYIETLALKEAASGCETKILLCKSEPKKKQHGTATLEGI